jgi:serine/threonine-protein kinase
METEKLGKYRLLSLIATGGMGEVFLARQEGPAGFSKTVVIKRILRHLADDQGFIDMFLNEARLAAQLQHPNIAQIFGLEHESDTWFIAMEHVHGRSCRACLNEAKKRQMRFPPRIAARICAQALQALHFAHRLTDEGGRPLGILHRDVSPDNVLVSFSGTVKLVDFGIAKAMTRSFTFTGRLKGKFTYMAPEQFIPGATIDPRIDVFAMGVLLHELVTLEMPANAPKSPEEAVLARGPYVSRPDLPPELNAILERALHADPSKRWESADAFSHALEEFIASSGEPLTPAHVAGFLEELFGRDVVMTNPSVATMEPIGGGHRGTDVLPLSLGGSVPPPSDMWAVSPTVIEPALQGSHGRIISGPDMIAVAPPQQQQQAPAGPAPARWSMGVTVGAAVVILGVGLWMAFRAPERAADPIGVAQTAALRPVDPVPVAAPDASTAVAVDPITPVDDNADTDPEPDAGVGSGVKKWHRATPKPGHVTVRVNPWAEVFYKDKSYGTTPLKHPIDVPPGTATFVLKNPQLGVNKKVSVKVAPGAEVLLKADLFKK